MKVTKHTQIIAFVNGSKKTIEGVVDITEGSLCKLTTEKGVEYLINGTNVLYVIRGYTPKDLTTDEWPGYSNLNIKKKRKIKSVSQGENYF